MYFLIIIIELFKYFKENDVFVLLDTLHQNRIDIKLCKIIYTKLCNI
jgi:hypothetical protein